MIRRLAAILLSIGSVILTASPDFAEADTVNLSTLITGGGSLTEGDKTFSNFTFSPDPPVGTAVVTPASDIFVTATTVEGIITLIAPVQIRASGDAGASIANISFGFDVTVAGGDAITGVGVDVVGEGGTSASAVTFVTSLDTPIIVTSPTNSANATLPTPLTTLEVDVTANVVSSDVFPVTRIDILRFTFPQTQLPSAPVPEPGSLPLILGGLGMLLVRGVYRRIA